MSLISNKPIGSSVGVGTGPSAITNKPVGATVGLGTGPSAITNQPVGATVGLGTGPSAITNQPVGATIGLGTGPSAITNRPVGSTITLPKFLRPKFKPADITLNDPQDTQLPISVRPPKTEQYGPPPPTPPFNQSFDDLIANSIQPNPLNSYWQPTYHIKLFICQDGAADNLSSAALLDSNQTAQVIIAESGVTGYNIRDLEINTVIAQSGTTRDQQGTEFTMTVVEPIGISFFDALCGAGPILGIWDYTKCVYLLEVSFIGYNEDGSFAPNLLANVNPAFKNGGKWIWALSMTTIDTKINEGGGVYTIKFINREAKALILESQANKTPVTIQIPGDTLGELFDNLAKKLTENNVNTYGSSKQGPLLTYKIDAEAVIPFGPNKGKKISNFPLKTSEPTKNPVQTLRLTGKGTKAEPTTAAMPPGMSVNEFITSAIKCTEEGQKLILDEPDPKNIDNSAKKRRVSTLFSIEPTEKIVGTDQETGNYLRELTLHVRPFYTESTNILTRSQNLNAKSPSVQRDMIKDLLDNGMLKKRYDYLFTGMNTEVLDFNISFNLAWQAMLPKLSGYRMAAPNEAVNQTYVAPPPKDAPAQNEPPKDPELNAQNIQSRGSASKSGDTTVSTEKKADGVVGNAAAQSSPSHFQPVGAAATALEGSRPGLQQPTNHFQPLGAAATALEGSRPGIQGPSRPGQSLVSGPTAPTAPAPTPISRASIVAERVYMEDILTRLNQGQSADQFLIKQVQPGSKLVLPISFNQEYQNIDNETGGAMIGPAHRGRSLVGSIFAQAFESTLTGGFQSIELTIRGDPYWLGQSNLERQTILNAGGGYDRDALPDWSSYKPAFFLHFRYPLQIGDDFKPIIKDSEAFNGLYEVVKVKHTFSEGALKQVLTANRMVLINLNMAYVDDPVVNNDAASRPVGSQTGSGSSTPNSGTPNTNPGSSQIAPTGSLPNDAEKVKRAQDSYNFWTANGYSPAAASGMVANEEAESGFDWTKPGDSGAAQGAFQWHDDRRQAILAGTGIDVGNPNTTHEQQLQAALWEQTQGPEKSAGNQIRAAQTGGEAGSIASVKYERPADTAGQAQIRGGRGAFWQQQFGRAA